MIIYIDSLLVINAIVNYFLLIFESLLLGIHAKRMKLAVGAVLGSFFTLFVLLPPLPFFLSVFIKLASAAVICSVSFGTRNLVRNGIALFGISTILAGVILLLQQSGVKGVFGRNLFGYLNISPILLLGCVCICYAAIHLFCFFFPNALADEKTVAVHLPNGIVLRAFLDTGNMLRDLSGKYPAMILRSSWKGDILSESQQKMLSELEKGSISEHATDECRKFRIVPYSGLEGDGILYGVKIASCRLFYRSKMFKTGPIVVCFCEADFGSGIDAVIGDDWK